MDAKPWSKGTLLRRALNGLGAVGVIAVIALVKTKRTQRVQVNQVAVQPPPSGPPQEPKAAANPAQTRRIGWPALATLPVAATAIGSVWLFTPLISGAAATIALVGCAVALRGPQPAVRPWAAKFLAGYLFAATAVIGYLVVQGSLHFVLDIGSLLVLAVASIATIAVLAWLVSTWACGGHLLEPGALGLIAVILTAISVQGIATLGAPLDTRQARGIIDAFAADPSLSLRVTINVFDTVAIDPNGTYVTTAITTTPTGRWALVLEGDARLRTQDLNHQTVAIQDLPYANEQLVSGTGSMSFFGRTITPLTATSASRAAFRFPAVGKGENGRSRYLSDTWLRAIQTDQPVAPAHLDVVLDAGWIDTSRTVIQTSPPPEPDRARLIWHSQDDLLPSIFLVTLNQHADDEARNGFFGIAILLGIAGSCLVAAMQTVIRPSRRATRSSP